MRGFYLNNACYLRYPWFIEHVNDFRKGVESRSGIGRKVRRYVGWALALVILFFLIRTLWSSWDQVAASGFQFQFNWLPLGVSLVLLVIGRGFAVEAWRRILQTLGNTVTFRFAFYAWFISNLARFIPGNVWQLAAMMFLMERQGVSKMNVLLSQAVYAAIALSVAALYGLTLLPVVVPALATQSWFVPLAALALIALIIFFALPPVFKLIVNVSTWALQVVRRQPLTPNPAVSARNTITTADLPLSPWERRWGEGGFVRGLVPPLCSLTMWTLNGVAFWLFTYSITGVALERLPSFIAMNAAAYFVGYISFVTPSGLGFREGALALLLQTIFPAPVAVALAFLTRIWSTIGEMLGVGIAVWGAPRDPKRKTQDSPKSQAPSLQSPDFPTQ